MSLDAYATPFHRTESRRVPALSSLVLLAATACLAVAPAARAGLFDPSNRFERVGPTTLGTAATLTVPDGGRLIVFEKNGHAHRVVGNGLVDEDMGTVDVSQTCTGDGFLSATWDPGAAGRTLYATYISTGASRKFTVARLTVDAGKLSAPTVIYQIPAPADCTNLGGGVAVGLDGFIYVGIGDFGNGASAGSTSTNTGKIMRMDSAGNAAAGNPLPGKHLYGLGVRNPRRLALDVVSGSIYFIDVNAGSNDELNKVGKQVNYGWPIKTGPSSPADPVADPVFTWRTAIDPTGLVIYRPFNLNLGRGAAGDAIVTSTKGEFTQVHLAVAPATETTLFYSTPGDPQSFVDVSVPRDGYLYLSANDGSVWRFRSDIAALEEPSDNLSIVPVLVRKMGGTNVEVSVERETAVAQYGMYVGDLMGTPHPDISTDYHAVDGNSNDAWTRFQASVLGPDNVAGTSDDWPAMTYFLVSAQNNRLETGLGVDSFGLGRRGGNRTFTCEPAGGCVDIGVNPGQCAKPFMAPYGIEGVGNVLSAPINCIDDFDCKVVVMSFSARWCGPCNSAAADSEALYQRHKDKDLLLLEVLIQGTTQGVPAVANDANLWATQYGLTYPTVIDDAHKGFIQWDASGVCGGGIPQFYMFDRNGVKMDPDPPTGDADMDGFQDFDFDHDGSLDRFNTCGYWRSNLEAWIDWAVNH